VPDLPAAGDPRPHAGGRRHRTAAAATVLGAVALVMAGVIWLRSGPAPDVGTATVNQLTAPVPAPASGAAGTAVPTQAAALPTAPVPVIAPVRLAIPVLNLTATVQPTGVNQAGDFDVPPSVDTVGWYRYGPGLDATTGSVVIAGHVDSATQGAGAFFRLRQLRPGDAVMVTGSDGRAARYTVAGREEYPKTAIDLNRYFTWTGAKRLTLITCGGPFNDRTHHYRDNVVVTAVPATG